METNNGFANDTDENNGEINISEYDDFKLVDKSNPVIYNQCLSFTVRIAKMCEYLKKKCIKSGVNDFIPLIEKAFASGTEIGIHVKAMERTKNFDEFYKVVNKALARSDEFCYWLDALEKCRLLSKQQFISMAADCDKIKDDLEAFFLRS